VPESMGTGPQMPETPNPGANAGAMEYQKYQMNLIAQGSSLGKGMRVAPEPTAGFSTPISGSQFGPSGNAKATFTPPPEGG